MKKEYSSPKYRIIEMKPESLIASSLNIGIDNDTEVDAGGSFSRKRYNDWDNIWK